MSGESWGHFLSLFSPKVHSVCHLSILIHIVLLFRSSFIFSCQFSSSLRVSFLLIFPNGYNGHRDLAERDMVLLQILHNSETHSW